MRNKMEGLGSAKDTGLALKVSILKVCVSRASANRRHNWPSRSWTDKNFPIDRLAIWLPKTEAAHPIRCVIPSTLSGAPAIRCSAPTAVFD
jgi:hypothetical protein